MSNATSLVYSRSSILDYIQGVEVVGAPHDAVVQNSESQDDTITSIRGLPSPALIEEIAQRTGLTLDEIDALLDTPQYIHAEPALTTRYGPFVVPVMTILRSNLSTLWWYSEGPIRIPLKLQESLDEYRSSLCNTERDNLGAEVFRNLDYLGSSLFAAEQQVTFIPYKQPLREHPTKWSAVILNDSSSRLSDQSGKLPRLSDLLGLIFALPNTRKIPKMPHGTVEPSSTSSFESYCDPCGSRRYSQKGEHTLVDTKGAGTAPAFYFDILNTSFRSWNRVFAFLDYRLSLEPMDAGMFAWPQQHPHSKEVQAFWRTTQLKIDKALAARAEKHFFKIQADLEGPFLEMMRSTPCDVSVRDHLDREHRHYRRMVGGLHLRAQRLQGVAQERLATEMALITIQDAKRSISSAERMELLTTLAFFFIPASFISSFFGMNLWPLTEQGPSLWVFFVVTVPVVGALGCIPFREHIALSLKIWRYHFRLWMEDSKLGKVLRTDPQV